LHHELYCTALWVRLSATASFIHHSSLRWHSMEEQDVGITQYATPDLPGFTAILKHRYAPAPDASETRTSTMKRTATGLHGGFV
jgi:hypothetical protein